MPTYLYKCKKCQNEFEVNQRITEDSLTECPLLDEKTNEACGGEVFRKISANIGLSFNGSGFYLTDYTSKKDPSATSKSKPKKVEKAETASTCPAGGSCSSC